MSVLRCWKYVPAAIQDRWAGALVIVILLGVLGHLPVYAESTTTKEDTVDHSIFSALLQEHVHGTRVDYDGFARDEATLDTYLDLLAEVDPERLSQDGQLAYWINVYNAWTIKFILSRWPDIDSIKDLGGLFQSPWKRKIVRTRQGVLTLDHVEHDIIRPVFQDARIHFAINCAAVSCPPLQTFAYTEADLQEQLSMVTARFLNSAENYTAEGNTLRVTKVMDWFAEDFTPSKHEFLLRFAKGELREYMLAKGETLRIRHLSYDWALNAIQK